ncbi:unnamed protein product, partial [Iphiclides podalirius]
MNFRSLLFFASFIGIEICSGEKQRHEFQSHMGHLNEIPKRFEIKGENAGIEFKKYISDITDLANKANVSVKYKVKVETMKPEKKYYAKKQKSKMTKSHRAKSKKYNVPLKNMKLSNFELVMRKHVDSAASRALEDEDLVTAATEKQPMVFTTRSLRMGKYKPVMSHIKTNYTKIVRPVRNKVITLTA